MLLRTAALGPFAASEISMLTFALDAALDLAAAASLEPNEVLRRLDSSTAGLAGDEARR